MCIRDRSTWESVILMSTAGNKTNTGKLDIEKLKKELEATTSRNRTILLLMLSTGLILFLVVIYLSPSLSQKERANLYRWPRSGEDLKLMTDVLEVYTKSNYYLVVFIFCYLYVLLQSFAIPGPLILSILSGALFGFKTGFILVCICATFGASACYMISLTLGKGLVVKYFPGRVVDFHNKVHSNRDHLFWYMLSLRLTPLVPNWLVNISSPIVGIPLTHFFFGTLLGLMPANIIHVRTGLTLSDIQKIGLNLSNIFLLVILGFVALIPTLIKKKIKQA
eukprot:TRINITY_DN3507_c0_g2_i2.p1 TRINITY_DN3507_c0_g2~~TRINITY_DN3507_c0_g2_i2.p1  ORF type:complete len:279 (-),score=36.67 TRINITY_DN3507_c0_g2_i2:50-886(-)